MANSPKTSDGKPIYLPNLFPGNVLLYITGIGDSTSTIGAGTKFNLSAINSTQSVDFFFKDWVYLAGGGLFYESASSDEVSIKLFAPASTVSAASGGNTGNCNLVNVGPGNIIVPAAGNGTHNLVSGTPIPSYDEENGEAPDGYWDWSEPDTGSGTITANATATGKFDLFDFDIDLAYFVRNLQLVGNSADGNLDITVSAIKPKKILPQWKFRAYLTSSGLHTVKIGWYLVTARRKTI